MNVKYFKTLPGYLKLVNTVCNLFSNLPLNLIETCWFLQLLGFLCCLINIIVFNRNVEINSQTVNYPVIFGWELFFHVVIGGFFITTTILLLSNLVFEGVSPFVSLAQLAIFDRLLIWFFFHFFRRNYFTTEPRSFSYSLRPLECWITSIVTILFFSSRKRHLFLRRNIIGNYLLIPFTPFLP